METYHKNPNIPFRAVLKDPASKGDGALPLLSIAYSHRARAQATNPAPTDYPSYCALTIDNDGATDASTLILLLNIGVSAADYTQYQFSANAAAITDPGGVDSSPTHTTVTDLGALVDALNAVDGITAQRLHAPADYAVNTDDFVNNDASGNAVSAVMLHNEPYECLYRDASEVSTLYMRLGTPRAFDAAMLELVRFSYNANVGTGATAYIKLSQDPTDGAGGETDEVELRKVIGLTDNSETEWFNEYEAPSVYQGPVLIELVDAASIAENGELCGEFRLASL